MKTAICFRSLITASLLALFVANMGYAAADKEKSFRKGRGGNRGNERSERITRLAVGNPTYRGVGCPEGSMNLVFAPDFLSFSILFDSFVAEVGTDARKKRDVMSCDLIVPFEIPEGMQMEITRVDFRGFVGLPDRGRAVLHSVFNFLERDRGQDRDRINLRYKFDGPVAENYEISSGEVSDGRAPDTEVSPCGGRVNLRVRNQLKVVSGARGETATATIDSIDGSSNAVYYVNWRQCQGGNQRLRR